MLLVSFLFPVCSFFISFIMLRVGHKNVYHLYNKVPDLCVFLSQSTPNYNICGITESRLNSRNSDQDINILNYCISRKNSIVILQTGIAVYIRNSIADIIHRRKNLENDLVEFIWLELKASTNAPNIFIFYFDTETLLLLMNAWFDNFVQMIDNIHTVKPHADILVLGNVYVCLSVSLSTHLFHALMHQNAFVAVQADTAELVALFQEPISPTQ